MAGGNSSFTRWVSPLRGSTHPTQAEDGMNLRRRFACALAICAALAGGCTAAAAQAKPQGEMRWVLYALHDALVKPMPGNPMAPSLAESWTASADQTSYEFKLRAGVKFHNGDPFTAEDVKFSFERAKAKQNFTS